MSGFHLERVPQPPCNGVWRDVLRWMICVMDGDDPDLAFTASLYAHCLKYQGLTERQGKYAIKIFNRMQAHFDAGTLESQAKEMTE